MSIPNSKYWTPDPFSCQWSLNSGFQTKIKILECLNPDYLKWGEKKPTKSHGFVIGQKKMLPGKRCAYLS